MWKINGGGNACNPKTGETMFVNVAVVRRERECSSCTNWLGDFNTVKEAKDFIRAYVAHEILIKISVIKQDKCCGGHQHWMGEFASVEDAQTFIKEMVAELNDAEETDHVED